MKFSVHSSLMGLQNGTMNVPCYEAMPLVCGLITSRSLKTNQHDSIPWKIDDNDYSYRHHIVPQQPPISVAFMTTTDAVLLAIGYRKHPVLIWNALELRLLGQCTVDANNGIDDMVFNPNPDIIALVVSCNDGRLCLFDYKRWL